jgi:site-specific recombinase XerD
MPTRILKSSKIKLSKKDTASARDYDQATISLDFGEVSAWPDRSANESSADAGVTPTTEPTWREVNRQIREENKQAKQRDRSKARGVGAGQAWLEAAIRRHPGDPKKQSAYFLENFVIKSGTGRNRPVAYKTGSTYGNHLAGAINDLRSQRAAISNLSEIGRTHMIILVRHWIRLGQSGSTIENKLSVLRRLMCFWGKEGAIPRGEELKVILNQNGMEVDQWRRMVSVESLAWSDKGVDFRAVIQDVKKLCPITAMQLEVQSAFGLRMSESLHLEPRGADYGEVLRVVHGTKGGLPRDVPFDQDLGTRAWQRDVLERAKLMAMENRKGQLTRDGFTLQQNKDHFYYVLKKLGITRKDLGVTAHGLRHEYAARYYEQVTGQSTPVSGSLPGAVSDEILEADKEGRRRVSRVLGHFRPDVAKAYIGSIPMMEKMRKKRVAQWLDRTEGNVNFVQALTDAGIGDAWLGGRFAAGKEVDADEKLRLIVRRKDGKALTAIQRASLNEALTPLLSRAVDLSDHVQAGEPDDALALSLRLATNQKDQFENHH